MGTNVLSPVKKTCIALIAITLITNTFAADKKQTGKVKQLSGISIVGDKETPKSLYIVPWHNAELEQYTRLTSSIMNSDMQPVDRDSLLKELELFELGKSVDFNSTPR